MPAHLRNIVDTSHNNMRAHNTLRITIIHRVLLRYNAQRDIEYQAESSKAEQRATESNVSSYISALLFHTLTFLHLKLTHKNIVHT